MRERLAEAEPGASETNSPAPAKAFSRKVFVVHGHDEGARETVARFLERLGFEAIILHEQASRGRTVIEKVEVHGDVGFAVVLLTPDDVGCRKDGTPVPRARQNVLLELGYFVGRLGRDRVCALKRGDLEIPSDFGGTRGRVLRRSCSPRSKPLGHLGACAAHTLAEVYSVMTRLPVRRSGCPIGLALRHGVLTDTIYNIAPVPASGQTAIGRAVV